MSGGRALIDRAARGKGKMVKTNTKGKPRPKGKNDQAGGRATKYGQRKQSSGR